MRHHIFLVSVVNVVRCHQRNSRLTAHAQQLRIDHVLLRNSMILKFQKEVALSENIQIPQSSFLSLLVHPAHEIPRDLSCQAGRQRYDTLVVFAQQIEIYPRFIIKTFSKATGYDLHQITVSRIILCQKNQVIIPL